MPTSQELTQWALSKGLRLNGIAAHNFPQRGMGIVAKKHFHAGDVLLSVPLSALRTERTVPENIRNCIKNISVQGLLATDLMLDTSQSSTLWKDSVPTKEDMKKAIPFMWEPMLQALLPEAASKLLAIQKQKFRSDWDSVSAALPAVSYDDFVYSWFIVGTRTFYYTHPDTQEPLDSNECLALVPFADYFNHVDVGCKVTFSSTGYTFCAERKIRKGEEICTNYGNHSNDFLLAEYGFVLEDNKWDEIPLDKVLLTLFSAKQKEILQEENFWGDYVLDEHSVCYRTQVAVRLLCMPIQTWRNSLESGFDDYDEYQGAADTILREALGIYSKAAYEKLEQVLELSAHLASPKGMLGKRWKQIHLLISTAIDGLGGQKLE
ncbi:hypothetical protein LTR70_010040 [Exophiala xenobiotica]|uniref:SET domain-containing protein n=1 Tax=Lithohypha guttulata TaxID=1690604 RepID=A0ABR0JWD0_9EURO|nr:hypothetical protein LTR24_009937 [Lithohypha guttulata]KAK5309728.1 hypothetical protein LTR70_010040 [Exophiala xenobiotica]